MTKFQRTTVIVSLGIVGFFAIMGLAGDFDYCDEVILSMSQEQYDSVRQLLMDQDGSEPTDRDIAHWWINHHHK